MKPVSQDADAHEGLRSHPTFRDPGIAGGDCSGRAGRRRTLGLLGLLAAGLVGGGLLLGRLPALQAAPPPTVLVLGDSLSTPHRMAPGRGWVALLQARIEQLGLPHKVVNASLGGEKTAGGRKRLGPLLAQHRPAMVLIELGGNDGLSRVPPSEMADNLRAMIQMSREAGAHPVVLGMQMPRALNPRYRETFAEVFPHVSREQQATLVPFFLEAVTAPEDMPRYFHADGIHPNELAQPAMLDSVWRVISPLLQGQTQAATR